MKEFDLLSDYPAPATPRYVSKNIRTIENRINASYRGYNYYDGHRNDGYGGYSYDGRWIAFSEKILETYQLSDNSSILHIGCEKGFLLNDLNEMNKNIELRGYEMSSYAIEQAMPSIKHLIDNGRYNILPYSDNEFDFVLAIGVVYTLCLADAISCLKEIQRVSKGNSFVTLGSFSNNEEERLFRMWSVLGCTILHESDWKKVLTHAGYTGDYKFVGAKTLNLIELN